jgi:hypothetical protein
MGNVFVLAHRIFRPLAMFGLMSLAGSIGSCSAQHHDGDDAVHDGGDVGHDGGAPVHDDVHPVATSLPASHVIESIRQIPVGSKLGGVCALGTPNCYLVDLRHDVERYAIRHPHLRGSAAAIRTIKHDSGERDDVLEEGEDTDAVAASNGDAGAGAGISAHGGAPDDELLEGLVPPGGIFSTLVQVVAVIVFPPALLILPDARKAAGTVVEIAADALAEGAKIAANALSDYGHKRVRVQIASSVKGYGITVNCPGQEPVSITPDTSALIVKQVECDLTSLKQTLTVDVVGKDRVLVWRRELTFESGIGRTRAEQAKLFGPAARHRFTMLGKNAGRFGPFNDGPVISSNHYSEGAQRVGFSGGFNYLTVFVTPDHERWMEQMPHDAKFRELRTWTIPGSHDAGMYERGIVLLATKDGGSLELSLSDAVESAKIVAEHFANEQGLSKFAESLALTQDDTIGDQLRLGMRYFDIRPGVSKLDKTPIEHRRVHIVHGPISGASFDTVLGDTIRFLLAHHEEVVFFDISGSGINAGWRPASDDEIKHALSRALSHELKSIQATSTGQRSIDAMTMLISLMLDARSGRKGLTHELRIELGIGDDASITDASLLKLVASGRRFIFIDGLGSTWDEAAYQGGKMVERLEAGRKCVAAESVAGTNFQLQPTPKGTDIALTGDNSILGNRMFFNPQIFDWLEKAKLAELPSTQSCGMRVLSNDFVDNLLTEAAIRGTQH